MNKGKVTTMLLFAILSLVLAFVLRSAELAWVAVWPSAVALLGIFIFRNVIASLLFAAWVGAAIMADGDCVQATVAILDDYLLTALQDGWNLRVLLFTLILGSFAALIEKGGGVLAWVEARLREGAGSDRGQKVQLLAFMVGIVCFFDGLANCLLVGKSFRPLADRVGLARAKLAYIVDSTSSAVACVSIISTWIAFQLSMIRQGYQAQGLEVDAFAVFLRSLPYNFYCWSTLFLMAWVIGRNWNWGPMAKEEALRAVSAGELPTVKAASWQAWLPVSFLIVVTLLLLVGQGAGEDFDGSWAAIRQAVGAADSAKVLLWSSLLAVAVAYLCNYRTVGKDSAAVCREGARSMGMPLCVLVSAWVLSGVLKQLGAAQVIASAVQGDVGVVWLPVVTFLLGALISFSTGTSWGTMGVLMPLVLPVVLVLAPDDPSWVAATVGAVFSGAVFGDHCSPLSDTTVVCSIACEVSVWQHVSTQLPYALLTAAVSLIAGFVPLALGVSPWLALLFCGLSLSAVVLLATRTRKYF